MEHLLPLKVEYLLMFGTALFWTIVYILVIYKGLKDQTCGMPLPSICANITWEFLFTFLLPFHPLQQVVTLVWFLLDCIILLQYFFYSKKLYPQPVLIASVFSLLVIALLLHIGIAVEFQDKWGIYSAFGINLLMSILFIQMLLKKGMQGQSRSIAFFKLAGTLCASLFSYLLFPHSFLLPILYVLIFILDAAYLLMISQQSIRTVHKSPPSMKAI
ncbi:transmembrane-type terpene cyclase [Paenibacillus nasutitermitis]|uniref:Uncharacterized protein n=1 Tax=Paenibacillus nasutitermitis TaxID=1652958 RepID=A0A916YNT5_9BACL|nr:hypothetical protein [Paenibacillus nasutitermitis]GGD54026.1 hypothetical protein GCM10010911_09430 [Paenibacillus nasutitermitis]